MSQRTNMEEVAIRKLIRLVSVGARGESVDELVWDWQEVIRIATEQNVETLVACALVNSPQLVCPEPIREYLLDGMRTESAGNLIRKHRILSLLSELKAAGIDARIIKGYAVARYYRYPDSRKSVDTDLLISAEQEETCIQFMRERGFRVDPRTSTSHHTVCQHPKLGMVELHVSLYAELIRDVWFQNLEDIVDAREPALAVMLEEGSFSTLGHTDQLIFLTLHLVKHFILGAVTLRMMLDIALYFACNRTEVDTERFWSVMEKLRYRKLVNCILWTMVKYGGFRTEDFPGITVEMTELEQRILDDMLEGGYLGCEEKEARQESGMEYNRQLQLKTKSQGQYVWHMLRYKLRGSVKRMCLTGEQLKREYPVAEKFRISIPFVWMYHAAVYLVGKLRSGALQRDIRSGSRTSAEMVEKRMELFRMLDMI